VRARSFGFAAGRSQEFVGDGGSKKSLALRGARSLPILTTVVALCKLDVEWRQRRRRRRRGEGGNLLRARRISLNRRKIPSVDCTGIAFNWRKTSSCVGIDDGTVRRIFRDSRAIKTFFRSRVISFGRVCQTDKYRFNKLDKLVRINKTIKYK